MFLLKNNVHIFNGCHILIIVMKTTVEDVEEGHMTRVLHFSFVHPIYFGKFILVIFLIYVECDVSRRILEGATLS